MTVDTGEHSVEVLADTSTLAFVRETDASTWTLLALPQLVTMLLVR